MIRFALAFVAGAWLFQFQPRLPDVSLFWLYGMLLLGAIGWPWWRLPLLLVAGFAWAHGHALLTAPQVLPPIAAGEPTWAMGQVDSLVDVSPVRTRFTLRITELETPTARHAGDWRVLVSWYRDPGVVRAGERWRLQLRLRTVSGYANPGGFDYPRWLYQQGIRYRASVVSNQANRRLAPAAGLWVTRAREALAMAIHDALPGSDAAALLQALVVGDRRGFGDGHWATFRATGTNHLVAISGLHIGLVGGLVTALVAMLWRRWPRLCARWPALAAGGVVGMLAATAYAALAGFAVPTQRALIMLGVALWALCAGRVVRRWDALALALVLVVAWSPMAVLSAGTWLSFTAVAVILLVAAPREQGGRLPWWQQWTRLQWSIALGLAPLLVLFFQQASLVSPLVNVVLVPWFSLVLIPWGLLASLVWLLSAPLGVLLWRGWAWLAEPTLNALQAVAALPWAAVSWATPGPLASLLALCGAALLLGPRGLPGRGIGAVLLLPSLLLRSEAPERGAYELTLVDVGQGLAAVVRTRSHVLLYDAGPRFASGFNTGSAVVAPFLRELGVGQLDALIVSHGDNDHAGGVPAVRQGFEVARVLAGEVAAIPGAEPCQAGQSWRWDGVQFEILHPPPGHTQQGNNASCVLLIDNGEARVLLTGDIEAEVERQLLRGEGLSKVDVVVVPHHGSSSSSQPNLVRRLAPSQVLYAAGRDNRWGFPRPEVVGRWSQQGAQGWVTGREGALTVRVPAHPGPVRIATHRRHRYWQP